MAAPVDAPAGGLPPRNVALLLIGVSVVVIASTAWAAVQPSADGAQTGFVRWFNDPPQPLAAVLAVADPFLRPVPLAGVAVVLVGWVLLRASGAARRLEVARSAVLAVVLAEAVAQVTKRLADQPRPTAVIPGLDVHGYPADPLGNAYPSAHTAVVVAVVSALWPWTTWPQRVAGLVVALLLGADRIHIGAHWPLDVVGGAAVGLLAGALTWLIAARWPIQR